MPPPRARYPHLERRVERGKTFWYVRINHGPRYRIKVDEGGEAFRREYQRLLAAAMRGERPSAPQPNGTVAGTLHWLWGAYTNSAAWDPGLAPSTRRQRENIMKRVLASARHAPLAEIGRNTILAGMAKRAKTPSAANNYLNTLRGLFEWAKKFGHVKVDPTEGVEHVARPKGSHGFPEWTQEDEEKFIKRWPKGTRQYLAYMVHACTGLRRGDAVRLGRQHFGRDGKIHIVAEKNKSELHIAVHQDLVDAIEACPPSGLFILETLKGKPWVKESYGNEFHDWTVAAGIVAEGQPKNSHGIRKLAATRVCDAGASEAELMALFGWKTVAMAQVYTKARDQKRLAAQAAAKIGAAGALVPLFTRGEGGAEGNGA